MAARGLDRLAEQVRRDLDLIAYPRREATDDIMAAIQDLSGQEYVDRDAAQFKREADRERKGSWEGEMGE